MRDDRKKRGAGRGGEHAFFQLNLLFTRSLQMSRVAAFGLGAL